MRHPNSNTTSSSVLDAPQAAADSGLPSESTFGQSGIRKMARVSPRLRQSQSPGPLRFSPLDDIGHDLTSQHAYPSSTKSASVDGEDGPSTARPYLPEPSVKRIRLNSTRSNSIAAGPLAPQSSSTVSLSLPSPNVNFCRAADITRAVAVRRQDR